MAAPARCGCYLLVSRAAGGTRGRGRGRGRTYVGFTNAPARRLRQHNGAVAGGARATRAWRPWDMAVFVHGFPAHSPALAFEWHWQHPTRSTLLRAAAAEAGPQGRSGGRGRVRMMHALLHQEPFRELPLIVQVLDSKYSELLAGLGPFPANIPVIVAPVETLFTGGPGEGPELSAEAGDSWGSSAEDWEPEDIASLGEGDEGESPLTAGTSGLDAGLGADLDAGLRHASPEVYDLESPSGSEPGNAASDLPPGPADPGKAPEKTRRGRSPQRRGACSALRPELPEVIDLDKEGI